MSIGIRKREDIRRWEVSRLDWKCWVFMDRKEVIIKVPFLNSSSPSIPIRGPKS